MISKEYTLDNLVEAESRSFNRGFYVGQAASLKLDFEFSKNFFKKIRLNPDTQMYEIPKETYEILKMQILKDHDA